MRRSALMLAGVLLPVLAWLRLAPPDVVRVGAGYTAKIVCSSVFISGRDPDDVLALDAQAPGHPLLRLMRVSVDREQRVVRAGLFGFAGDGLARAAAHHAPAAAAVVPTRAPWPDGGEVGAASPALQALLDDAALVGPGVRAVVVLHRARPGARGVLRFKRVRRAQ